MNRFLSIIFVLSLINSIEAQDESVRKKHFNIVGNVALSGYDPITYFVNKPLPGKKSINYTYKGITYQFLNEKSRSLFESDPEKYEPQYGGWCAYALAKTKPVLMESDPETYKIVDGKLYVFYNSFGVDILKKWNKNEAKSKELADKNWKNIIKK